MVDDAEGQRHPDQISIPQGPGSLRNQRQFDTQLVLLVSTHINLAQMANKLEAEIE